MIHLDPFVPVRSDDGRMPTERGNMIAITAWKVTTCRDETFDHESSMEKFGKLGKFGTSCKNCILKFLLISLLFSRAQVAHLWKIRIK